jgi:hypothetical protein
MSHGETSESKFLENNKRKKNMFSLAYLLNEAQMGASVAKLSML